MHKRLTILETVYYQSEHNGSFAAETRLSEELVSDEQPYIRKLILTAMPVPLDHGWVQKPRLIVIRNDEGYFSQMQPTEEERKEMAAKIVIVCINGSPALEIRPQDSLRLCLHGPGAIKLSASPYNVKCTITAVPE